MIFIYIMFEVITIFKYTLTLNLKLQFRCGFSGSSKLERYSVNLEMATAVCVLE